MSTLFRRHTNLRCFFCHSTGSLNQDPRNFKCHACGCWNRYDQRGEILSDEPAMHDESLNSHSFARRASPSKDRLPTAFGKSPLCHTCQTNQMLVVNLLASYLPRQTPDYRRRLDKLPEYKESLHARYPPVCSSCLPAVEEEIRNKDHMARTKALGGWLKESKGKDRQRHISGTSKDRDRFSWELFAWRARGILWASSFIAANSGYLAALLQYPIPTAVTATQPFLPIFTFISLFWTAWDPTYSSVRKAQLQGRDVRVRGKRGYIVVTISLFTLRFQHPPAIRLIDSKSHTSAITRSGTPIDGLHSRATTPGAPLLSNTIAEPDLTALSLSSKPIINPPKPVFGHPSLPSAPLVPPPQQPEAGADEMDWAPTDPVAYAAFQKRKHNLEAPDDGSWIRPQRFFAPEKPTGLEGLFEKTRLTDDAPPSPAPNRWRLLCLKALSHLQSWWYIYILSCITVLFGVGYKWWLGHKDLLVE